MIVVREYGAGPIVIALHGGPGAPGYMAPVARELAADFLVLEPLQRSSGDRPLTVALHLADLHDVIASRTTQPVSLIGSSWGAMLALAYAAEHPAHVNGVVAIGCGTFDESSRQSYRSTVDGRITASIAARIREIENAAIGPDEKLARKAEAMLPAYSHDLVTADLEMLGADARSNRESWADMLRLQKLGVYPQAFTNIAAPVVMLHGTTDPHPGPAIRDSLAPFVRRLVYHEWPDCGHYPWLERSAREEFHGTLRSYLRSWHAAAV